MSNRRTNSHPTYSCSKVKNKILYWVPTIYYDHYLKCSTEYENCFESSSILCNQLKIFWLLWMGLFVLGFRKNKTCFLFCVQICSHDGMGSQKQILWRKIKRIQRGQTWKAYLNTCGSIIQKKEQFCYYFAL